MVMVYGVAGLRDSDSVLSFWPRLTRGLERLRFPLQVQGQVLEVDITPESITYSLRRGEGMLIRHYNEDIRLSAENPAAVRPFKT
jgi:alpha,alpha-trehalose phosphorylase